MKVIVDTNVVLDVLLARNPFVDSAAGVFALAEQSEIHAFLCATTLTTVDYLLRQSISHPSAQKALHRLLEIFDVAPVNRSVIEEAIHSKMNDFEDAVIAHSGHLAGAEIIITRNSKDFRKSPIRALEPTEFILMFKESRKHQ